MDEGLHFLHILGANTPPMDVGDWMRWKFRRVSFFVWCVAWNKILTGDNLKLRRLVFVDWCIMCRHCGETVDHLFLHCEMVYRFWSFVFITFGLS